jgi:aspartate/methionine/tyrosine aminotransferase
MADVVIQPKHFLSDKVEHFTESVIREMTRQAMLHGAVNLAQGFPDFSAPDEIKRAAQEAVAADVNQYAITWGAKSLRNAIAQQMQEWQGIVVDPQTQITVCCGSTEAMISTLLAVCNKGDEVVIFEPFYENYGPDSVLSGAKPVFVKLHPPPNQDGEWTFDERELRAAFHHQTKAIILNTPNNPTGKVFTRAELELIRDLCVEFNVLAITDEIYEHILYDGTRHISMAGLEGMSERTVTINGLSKSYSVTGWRVGWQWRLRQSRMRFVRFMIFLPLVRRLLCRKRARWLSGCRGFTTKVSPTGTRHGVIGSCPHSPMLDSAAFVRAGLTM